MTQFCIHLFQIKQNAVTLVIRLGALRIIANRRIWTLISSAKPVIDRSNGSKLIGKYNLAINFAQTKSYTILHRHYKCFIEMQINHR